MWSNWSTNKWHFVSAPDDDDPVALGADIETVTFVSHNFRIPIATDGDIPAVTKMPMELY